MKKSLLILSILLVSLSACNKEETSEDYSIYSNNFSETLNYIYDLGADTSKWQGIYGSTDTTCYYITDMSYYGEEGYDIWDDSYTDIDRLYAVEKNGKVTGYETDLFSDIYGDYIYDVYYDGSTIYTNDDGEISSISDYKMTLNDYTYYVSYYVEGEDSLPEQFEYMKYLHDLQYEEWPAYNISGTLSKTSSGQVKATLKATCDEDFYWGFLDFYVSYHITDLIQLDLVYDKDGSLISFNYTYEDYYYDSYGDIEYVTQYISFYEYDGEVPTPTWL